MSELQVASRYAKSLLDLAKEQNAVDAIKTDMESFIKVCKANHELVAVLKNPVVPHAKKIAILSEIFGKEVHPVVISFFKIVTNKGRGEILYATAKEFINEFNRQKGIVKARVVSAESLSDENKKEIIDVVKQNTSANEVILETKIDPDLIGGFVLTVGDKQFDASISNQLNTLKKSFAQKVVA
ncbi:ATP synthase F1 subunit delta [Pedobacter sp. HMF7647]|uniref:ATP synthase subunit delta n=1 Tax=Hufsiella arboris TaxID=2695275 RepID=A0A7K1Y443_9SPHI|nr:ATP synthase F1 subunit delta [Hufsiella arboris]MXV49356.1 ATP synthase F1 subunit delta [Hufsiella arboris]